jgi:hypothetical protein
VPHGQDAAHRGAGPRGKGHGLPDLGQRVVEVGDGGPGPHPDCHVGGLDRHHPGRRPDLPGRRVDRPAHPEPGPAPDRHHRPDRGRPDLPREPVEHIASRSSGR